MNLRLLTTGAVVALWSGAMASAQVEPAMPPPDDVIIKQANPVGEGVPTTTPPNPQTASEPVQPTMPADASYHAGPYKGALSPPPAEAMHKTYPMCSRTITDSCMQRERH